MQTASVILKAEWDRRKNKNPRYSLRAFAKSLNVSPAYLSMLLSGKRAFTESQVHHISDELNLSFEEREKLLLEIKLKKAGTSSAAKYYGKQLKDLSDDMKSKDRFSNIKEKEISLFSRWYYPALYELWQLTGGKVTAKEIARRLKIPEMEVQISMDRLKAAGILSDKQPKFVTSGNIRSETIRNWQLQMMAKASAAITQPNHKREHQSVTLAIDPTRLPKALEIYRKFRQELTEVLQGDNPSVLYAMNFQIFPLE